MTFGSPEATRSETAHRPAGYSSSLYGLEHGSTRVFGGKGRGKGGRRKPKKPKKKQVCGRMAGPSGSASFRKLTSTWSYGT